MTKKQDAWDLWHKRFKLGDEIIIITEEDKIHGGRLLMVCDDSCALKTLLGKTKLFYWEELVMVCNDGFPVKKLIGADGSESVTKEPSVKYKLPPLEEPYQSTIPSSGRTSGRTSGRSIGFRDPFLIESVYIELVNPGIEYNPYSLYEECLCLDAPNGAKGMLWDLDQIFYLGV